MLDTLYADANPDWPQLLRDNFNLSTWILVGCVIQSLFSFIFPRSYAAFPAILLLGWGIVDAFLMHFGLKKNIWYEGVIDGKWSVAYPGPGETEDVHGKPGDNGPGAVMILGARSNSALGMFDDGMSLSTSYEMGRALTFVDRLQGSRRPVPRHA